MGVPLTCKAVHFDESESRGKRVIAAIDLAKKLLLLKNVRPRKARSEPISGEGVEANA